MRLILLITIPYIIIWLFTRSRGVVRWILFPALLTVQFISLMPVVAIGIGIAIQPTQTTTSQLASVGSTMDTIDIYSNYAVSQPQLHGLSGWEGVDISAGCGSPIYAPFAGTVTYNGLDGYNHVENGRIYQQATMLTIKNDDLEMTLLHGDYDLPVGSPVKAGQIIGTENKRGWSSGCHSHVILRDNGRLVNYLEWKKYKTALAKTNSMPMMTADYPLRISWYDPLLGGTNCNHDCTTMASGDKVSLWLGGRNGVYAAACPRSDGWHHGKQFVLDDTTYECRDTGGYINCYQPGEYDPALKQQADMAYCWVDLLNGSQYQYGSLVYDWGFK